MKKLRIFWKWFEVTIEYMVQEIKKDLLKYFTKDYYMRQRTTLTSFFKSLKKIFISPKYLVYWAMIIVTISVIKKNVFWTYFSLTLYTIIWLWKVWVGGNPKKYYREKYFSVDYDK